MDRTAFFNEVTIDGQKELDFLDNSLGGFVMTRDPLYYRVMQNDIAMPDNIAYKVYGEERFWWVILLANNISNPAVDMTIGQLLKIPDLLDVYDFYKLYRKR